MSLVVGKIEGNLLRFISDSKVTNSNLEKGSPLTGILKSIILTTKRCVSFAGNNYFAEILLDEFYSNKIKSDYTMLTRCLRLNIESNNETDFCVGMINNNMPQIIKISNGEISSPLHDVWLGDKFAFNKYQQAFLEEKNYNNIFAKMEKSFEQVISDDKITSVGDFQFSIETQMDQDNNLVFLYYPRFVVNIVEQELRPTQQPQPILFGGADKGGYAISYFRSNSYAKPAIAIHIAQGNLGLLFCPSIDHRKAIVFTNEFNGEEFAFRISKKYDMIFEGFVENKGYAMKLIRTDK